MFQNPLENCKKSLKFFKEIKVMHITWGFVVHNSHICHLSLFIHDDLRETPEPVSLFLPLTGS